MLSQRTPNRQEHKQDTPSRISDMEATRLNAANSRGTDDNYFFSLSKVKNLASAALTYTLCNQSNGFDLRMSRVLEYADRKLAKLTMSTSGCLNARVHHEESLLRIPVELLDMVTTEGIDHCCYGRC